MPKFSSHVRRAEKCPEDIMSVTLHTNLGDLKVELFCEDARGRARTSRALRQRVLRQHVVRNIKGFMIQAVIPRGQGGGQASGAASSPTRSAITSSTRTAG